MYAQSGSLAIRLGSISGDLMVGSNSVSKHSGIVLSIKCAKISFIVPEIQWQLFVIVSVNGGMKFA